MKSFGTTPESKLRLTKTQEKMRLKLIEMFGEKVSETFTEWELEQLIFANKDRGFDALVERFVRVTVMKKEIDYENLLENELPGEREFSKLNPCFIHGVDKYGHPILWEKLCDTDVDTIRNKCDWDDFLLYRHRIMKKIRNAKIEISAASQKKITLHTMVIDLEGITLSQAKQFMTDPKLNSLVTFGKLYPQTIYETIFVNVNFWIRGFYNSMPKSEATSNKHLLGSDFHSFLRDRIDEKWIPQEFGGKLAKKCDFGKVTLPNFSKKIGKTEIKPTVANQIGEEENEECETEFTGEEIYKMQSKCALLKMRFEGETSYFTMDNIYALEEYMDKMLVLDQCPIL